MGLYSGALFRLGILYATPGAVEAMSDAGQTPFEFLKRHVYGDWGELCDEDKQLNDAALRFGGRLLSAYKTKKGVKLWVITESDRSTTTILLPDEY